MVTAEIVCFRGKFMSDSLDLSRSIPVINNQV
jgi:hypothetical protein